MENDIWVLVERLRTSKSSLSPGRMSSAPPADDTMVRRKVSSSPTSVRSTDWENSTSAAAAGTASSSAARAATGMRALPILLMALPRALLLKLPELKVLLVLLHRVQQPQCLLAAHPGRKPTIRRLTELKPTVQTSVS